MELDRWYHLRVEVDIDSDTFDYFLDGIQIADDAEFRTAQDVLTHLYVTTGQHHDIDNVSVRNGYDAAAGDFCEYDIDCADGGACNNGTCPAGVGGDCSDSLDWAPGTQCNGSTCDTCLFFDGFESSISDEWDCDCATANYCPLDAQTTSVSGAATLSGLAGRFSEQGVLVTPEFGLGMAGADTNIDLGTIDHLSFDFFIEAHEERTGETILTMSTESGSCAVGVGNLQFRIIALEQEDGNWDLLYVNRWTSHTITVDSGFTLAPRAWHRATIDFDWVGDEATLVVDGITGRALPLDSAFGSIGRLAIGAWGAFADPTVRYDNVCLDN